MSDGLGWAQPGQWGCGELTQVCTLVWDAGEGGVTEVLRLSGNFRCSELEKKRANQEK